MATKPLKNPNMARIPWNKGLKGIQKMSEETRRRMSESAKKSKNSGRFRKGMTSWIQGKTFSAETRKKMSEIAKKINHEKCDICGRIKGKQHLCFGKPKNEKNPFWKGDNVGYVGLHTWIQRNLGRPDECEYCGRDNLIGHQIHWANKDHTYQRNLNDWIRLCGACHKQYDVKNNYAK